MGFRQSIEVTVDIDETHLEDAGYHHEDNCQCDSDHVEDLEAFTQPHLAAADVLHDWHETEHGYTLWTMCQHGPCNNLTLDYRRRT